LLVSADEDVYRLLLRIQSDTFVRIIDPVDTMIRLARSLPYVECEHKENLRRIENPQDTIKLYNFDDLLGRWQNEETFYGVSKIGPTTLFQGDRYGDVDFIYGLMERKFYALDLALLCVPFNN
jgi:hypothetical protein